MQMGETPIIRAAHNGHLQTVRFLVENGADVNSIDMVSAGAGAATAAAAAAGGSTGFVIAGMLPACVWFRS